MLVLMTSWLDGEAMGAKPVAEEYQMIELFSGSARIARLANSCGYASVAVDTLYDVNAPPPRATKKERQEYEYARSAMDINTSAGFVLLAKS